MCPVWTPPPSPSCCPSSLHTTHGPTRPKGRGGSSYSKKNAGVSPRIPHEGKRPLAGRIPKRKSTLHQGRAHEQETRRAPARPEIERRPPRDGPLAIARRARARHSYGGQHQGAQRTPRRRRPAGRRRRGEAINARAVRPPSARTALRGGRRAGRRPVPSASRFAVPSAGGSPEGGPPRLRGPPSGAGRAGPQFLLFSSNVSTATVGMSNLPSDGT
jgi:hypothetical protein